MKRAGLVGLGLTLLLLIPVLFLLTRSAVSTNQFVVIAGVVLLFVMWTAVYVILVDPLLQSPWVGRLFQSGPRRNVQTLERPPN